MKKSATLGLLLASALLATSGATTAQTKDIPGDSKDSGYTLSPNGNVTQSGTGLCWRTGTFQTPQALRDCDPALMPPPPPPPPPPAPTSEKVTFAADARFASADSIGSKEAAARLDDLVSKLAGVNLEVVIVVGHTDNVGSAESNQKLSVRRAEAAKNYLVKKGIEPGRIYVEGKGETQPIADNKTAEGRAKNRRVEIEVVGTRTINR